MANTQTAAAQAPAVDEAALEEMNRLLFDMNIQAIPSFVFRYFHYLNTDFLNYMGKGCSIFCASKAITLSAKGIKSCPLLKLLIL